MKHTYIIFLLLLGMICLHNKSTLAQKIGDPGWKFDESKFDARIPAMKEWAIAGVENGIPRREANPTKKTLTVVEGDEDMADNINAAIENVAANGGGVVFLKDGTYPIKSQIMMKSDVILRGESRENTQLKSIHRHESPSGTDGNRVATIVFDNVTRSGLEDFTMYYSVSYNGEVMHPLDYNFDFNKKVYWEQRKQNFANRRVYHDRANYEYHDRNDLFVTFVQMQGNTTKNDWIDNCSFIESGSDHIFIKEGRHITIRNTEVNGSFQKGGQGNGYGINCYGEYVLMTKCVMKKVRHWAIQQGAKYCVVYDCHSETDMNFHQGDKGLNLIEKCEIKIPFHHSWDCYQTGASYHGSPGEANMFYNNDCFQKEDGILYNEDKIYTFEGKTIQVSSLEKPEHGVLYALIQSDPEDFIVTGVELSLESVLMEEGQTNHILATVSPSTATNQQVTWQSDDETVATVDNNGNVTAITEGTAVITGTTVEGNFIDDATVKVRKLDESLENVVYNKAASASVSDDNGPENLVDGDSSTRWSAEFYPQWAEIDLGEDFMISKTELTCFQNRAYTFTIETKDSEATEYTLLVDRTNNTTQGYEDNPITDNFEETEARYIKLTVTGASGYTGTWASISELKIWGKKESIPTAINRKQEQQNSVVFPNPFTSTLKIDVSNADCKRIEFINLLGIVVLSQEVNTENEVNLSLPYSTIPPGIYLLRTVGESSTKTYQVVRK